MVEDRMRGLQIPGTRNCKIRGPDLGIWVGWNKLMWGGGGVGDVT